MDRITEQLASELKQKQEYVENIVRMLDEGCTVPFIARYRKELHGAMDDQVIRELAERLQYLRNLEKRKEEILEAVETQGKLTEELRTAIASASTMAEVEDLYRPYKQKRRTRATVAREKGLEPLAELLYSQTLKNGTIEETAAKYINAEKGVSSSEEALAGANDIVAEEISDDAEIRRVLKALLRSRGALVASAASEEDSVYRMYYDFRENVSRLQGHRVLAINRGEREKFLKVKLEIDEGLALQELRRQTFRSLSISNDFVRSACDDAWKRLLFPSLEREIRSELTDAASEQAIRTFSLNLKPLLLQPPVRGRVTLGFDPGYAHGCKLAVVDATGRVLETGVVYPTPPFNKKEEAVRVLTGMIRRHGVTVIAVGNGTASRESEILISEILKDMPGVEYMMVSEAGASVYSASPLAAEEFPDYDTNLRSAVSIARRLQDPLAELVKIEPRAIGVGEYQHDMPEARLDETLGGVVEDCVNAVGVDLNTASRSLLRRVSGLTDATAKNIVAFREENGPYTGRAQLKKVPKIGPRAYEQCAGFLRIPGGRNPLDNTGVHPESYAAAEKLLTLCGYSLKTLPTSGVPELPQRLRELGEEKAAAECGVGVPTLRDIALELAKPGRDPRDELPPPMLRTDVMSISDLRPGMKLKGTVRNVVDFGAFVDIGVHQDGLVHISRICDRFIRHPSDVLSVGDIVEVTVLEADEKKGRISLSMRE